MRRAWAAALGGAAAMTLAACSASGTGAAPASQPLTITYLDGGESVAVDVEASGVRCSGDEDMPMLVADGDVDGRSPVTVSIVEGNATVAIHIDEDLWFVAGGEADAEEGSVSFDALVGSVLHQDADLTVTSVVDDAATLDGDLACT